MQHCIGFCHISTWITHSSFKPKAFFCHCSVPKLCPTLCDLMDSITPGSLSSTNFWSFRFMSTDSVMLFNLLTLCRPFSFDLQSFPAPRSFPMSQLFSSSGQSIGASASSSVFPMNIQGWLLLRLTSLISLLSNRHSRAFSSTTIKKHQFLGTQSSLRSHSHIHTWLLEKP